MNPKKIATVSAIALVVFLFCSIATLFAFGGYGLLYILGDTSASMYCFYVAALVGILALLSLVTAIISNTILVSLRF